MCSPQRHGDFAFGAATGHCTRGRGIAGRRQSVFPNSGAGLRDQTREPISVAQRTWPVLTQQRRASRSRSVLARWMVTFGVVAGIAVATPLTVLSASTESTVLRAAAPGSDKNPGGYDSALTSLEGRITSINRARIRIGRTTCRLAVSSPGIRPCGSATQVRAGCTCRHPHALAHAVGYSCTAATLMSIERARVVEIRSGRIDAASLRTITVGGLRCRRRANDLSVRAYQIGDSVTITCSNGMLTKIRWSPPGTSSMTNLG